MGREDGREKEEVKLTEAQQRLVDFMRQHYQGEGWAWMEDGHRARTASALAKRGVMETRSVKHHREKSGKGPWTDVYRTQYRLTEGYR
jgi:hypothetical protein